MGCPTSASGYGGQGSALYESPVNMLNALPKVLADAKRLRQPALRSRATAEGGGYGGSGGCRRKGPSQVHLPVAGLPAFDIVCLPRVTKPRPGRIVTRGFQGCRSCVHDS